MGVPIIDNLDLLQPKPLDSKMVWTGSATGLNNIPNKYEGLTTYVTGDKNLYIYKNINPLNQWEKIITNEVESIDAFGNLRLNYLDKGKIYYINSENRVIVTLPTGAQDANLMGNGYNVTIVQTGPGAINFSGNSYASFVNRLNSFNTAGVFSIASILKIEDSPFFLLYGDLV